MFWRWLASLISRVPWPWLKIFGWLFGGFVGSVLQIRRRQAVTALRTAGVSDPNHTVRKVYSNLGTGVFELLWTAGRSAFALNEKVSVDGWEGVERALAQGRGIVVATAHTGNWDLAACAMAQRTDLSVVTKHLSWASLDRFWQDLRAKRGVNLLDPLGALKHARHRLRNGGAVAFLIDQAPYRKHGTISAPFLGKIADHDTTFATVAARYGVPVVIALAQRDCDGNHVVHVRRILTPPPRASRAWIKNVTEQAAQELEEFVHEYPEQWLWLHRRWRRPARSN